MCSSDESGNVYKYLYFQDSPSNPSQGLVVSANAVSLYKISSRLYIYQTKRTCYGNYGGIKQFTGYYGLNPY